MRVAVRLARSRECRRRVGLTSITLAIEVILVAWATWAAAQPKVDLLGDPLPEGAIARCGTVRFLPRAPAWAVGISPDGKTIAVGNMPGSSSPGCVELWNTATAQRIAALASGSLSIDALAWAPDGRRLVVSHDDRVDIFAAFEGKVLATLPQPDPPTRYGWTIRWSADGRRIASHSPQGRICVWDAPSATLLRAFDCGEKLYGLALSADARRIAICGPGLLQLRDAERLETVWTHGTPAEEFASVAFSPDGTRLVCTVAPSPLRFLALPSGSLNLHLQTRDVREGRILAESERFPSFYYADVAFTPDGKLVASTEGKGKVQLWDAVTLKKRSEWEAPGYIGRHLSISADGKTLATADRRIMAWDVSTGRPRHHWETHGAIVHSVAFLPTDKTLVSAGRGAIYRWDAATGRMLRRYLVSNRPVGLAAVTHDGKTIAAGVSGNEIRFWDVESGKETLPATRTPLYTDTINTWSMEFRGDDKLLAYGLADWSVRLWDMNQHQEVRKIPQPDRPCCVRFSPDGKLLAVGTFDTAIRIYEVESAKELAEIPGSGYCVKSPCVFVPGGELIAVPAYDPEAAKRQGTLESREHRVRLWDYAHGRSLWESPLLCWPEAISVSPDGRLVVASVRREPRTAILVWSVKTGKLLRKLQGHEEGIAALAFSSDSARLASAGEDGTLLVWDLSTLPREPLR